MNHSELAVFVRTDIEPVLEKLRDAGFTDVEAFADDYKGEPVVVMRARWDGELMDFSMTCGAFAQSGQRMSATYVLNALTAVALDAIRKMRRTVN